MYRMLFLSYTKLWHSILLYLIYWVTLSVNTESFVTHPQDLINFTCPYTSCNSARSESPNEMTESVFRRSRCYCDSGCHRFGDCCFDEFNQHHTEWKHGVSLWGCRHLKAESKDIYMITACPGEHRFASLCSKNELSEGDYDYKQDIPVLNHRSGVWYQNIYCAYCHGEQNNLSPLSLHFECTRNLTAEEVLQNGTYIPQSLTWTLGNDTCEVKVETVNSSIVQNNAVPRRCRLHESNCAADWAVENIKKLCQSYAYFVYRRNGGKRQVFKNPHCALCNNVKMSNLYCWSDDGGGSDGTPLSLITLVTLQWRFDDGTCDFDTYIYDPLHEKCVAIEESCGHNAVFHNGVCITTDVNSSNFTSNTSIILNTSCPVINIEPGEFNLLNNSLQLTLTTSHQIIPEGEFEVLDNGSAKVCYDSVSNFPHVQDSYISTVCLSISVICLVLHNLIYCILPKLRALPAKNLFAMSVSLLLAQLLFLTGLNPITEISFSACVSIAVLIQYFFLSSFFWMNVISFDVWKTFAGKKLLHGSGGTHWKYAVYAWGVPALTVCTSLLFEYVDIVPVKYRPNYAHLFLCWFGSQKGLLIFFVSPMFVIILTNVIFFSDTVFRLNKTKKSQRFIENNCQASLLTSQTSFTSSNQPQVRCVQTSHVTGNRDKIQLYLFLKLFVIMGLTWLTGIAAVIFDIEFLRYTFVILNGLQGAFIFFMFDFKCRIGSMLWTTILEPCCKRPAFFKTSHHNTSDENSPQSAASNPTKASCL